MCMVSLGFGRRGHFPVTDLVSVLPWKGALLIHFGPFSPPVPLCEDLMIYICKCCAIFAYLFISVLWTKTWLKPNLIIMLEEA